MQTSPIVDPLFRRIDLDEIYYDYFDKVWSSGEIYADPSGWRDTYAAAAPMLPEVEIRKEDLGRYYLDEGTNLAGIKEPILELISTWENRTVTWPEVTLYSSVSVASAAVLVTLRRLGISLVLFETPAYAVTVNQARALGFTVKLIPTYFSGNFSFRLCEKIENNTPSFALWLTHPRTSLGYNQELTALEQHLSVLRAADYLIVDEATEQLFPSMLSPLADYPRAEQILRIRGLLKGLGLNGLRLACVLHDASLRESLESAQEILGASLDLYSLRAAARLGHQPQLFFTMLAAANRQVVKLRTTAEGLAAGSWARVTKVVNGYMGAALVDLSILQGDYDEKRRRLLAYCRDHEMPVILGASLLFAFDPGWEQVRLNYFNRDFHITRAIDLLSSFPRTIAEKV